MLVTLQNYILGELLRTFALTIVVLTGLFTLAGGLYNVLRYEGVTANDLVRLFPMLLPVVVTLTMPIAALFSTAMVYGRLASDNELTACRAAGINVHRLFRPAMLLSVFVALATTISVNFVIPEFMKRIEWYARANVRDFAFYQLQQRGYLRYDRQGKDLYTLTAQSTRTVPDRVLAERGFAPATDQRSYFWVEAPTFLWIDGAGNLRQYAVADEALCQFDTGGQQVEVSIYIPNGMNYELDRHAVAITNQKIGPLTAPVRFPVKPSMVDLDTLLAWRAAPWVAPDVADDLRSLRRRLLLQRFYAQVSEQLGKGEPLLLNGDEVEPGAGPTQYEIRAQEVRMGEGRPVLVEPRVLRRDQRSKQPAVYEAPEGRLVPQRVDAGPELALLELRLLSRPERPVQIRLPAGDVLGGVHEQDSIGLPRLRAPAEVRDPIAALAAPQVISQSLSQTQQSELSGEADKLERKVEKLRRRVTALIHFRLGYATSALVSVLMAAALGVVFLGSRALAAFGLACIPFAVVTLTAMTGRQLAEGSATEAIGPFVIWGGLALVALADFVLLRFGVRT